MKYFRHLTTGRTGDRLKPIYAEFGKAQGYGLYFMLLEMCAEKYNGRVDKFVFLTSELLSDLQLRRKSLTSLLHLLQMSGTITDFLETSNGKVIEFRWPDLVEISDDYSKKVRHKSDKNPQNIPPINKDINKDIEEEVLEEPPANLKDLNSLFANKIGESTYKRISSTTKQVWLELYGSDLNFIVRAFISAFGKWAERAPKDQVSPDTFFTTQLKYDWPHHLKHKTKEQTQQTSSEPSAFMAGVKEEMGA